MARDWAFMRYMTAISRARTLEPRSSSASARRVSALPRPPTRLSTWRAIHSASSSSLYASKRWIRTPPAFSVQSFLSLRALLRETTACAASRMSWVER